MTVSPEALRQARDANPNVAYQTFIKHINEDKDGIFCFYEGNDGPYYYSRVLQYVKNNQRSVQPIVCKGKEMVLKVCDLISSHKEYEKYVKAYFVDRDYDGLEEKYASKVYCTPCYSIENFYCKQSCISSVLKNELGLNEIDEDYKSIIQLYISTLGEFSNAITEFNAWYYCLKTKRNLEGGTTGVSLQDKFPRGYLQYNWPSITVNYNLDRIKEDFTTDLLIEDEIVYNKVVEFNEVNKLCTFRGKYYAEYIVKFFQYIILDSRGDQQYVKRRLTYDLQSSKLISMFSQYAYTPDCLIKYLQEIKIEEA